MGNLPRCKVLCLAIVLMGWTFPANTGAGRLPPRTLVCVSGGEPERGVRVETAHCYPNEDVVVFSQTRVVEVPR